MRKILFSFAVLLFLAAGICFTVLYDIGTRAIEDNIIEESVEKERMLESRMTEETSGIAGGNGEIRVQENKTNGVDVKTNDAPAKEKQNGIGGNTAATSDNTKVGNPQEKLNKEEAVALESVKKFENKVPIAEKISLTNLLISKLSPSDISELKGMLYNGITAEEKKRAKEILYSRLSSDDIRKIKEAYAKYTKQ